MRLRLRLLFVVLVVLPVAALAALGIRAARNEEIRAANEQREAFARILGEVAGRMGDTMGELERALLIATERLPDDETALLARIAESPTALRRLVLFDDKGTIRFPRTQAATAEERRTLEAAASVRGALAPPPGDESVGQAPAHGWQPSPGGDGRGLLFWRRIDSGMAVVVVPGVAVLDLLISKLPATSSADPAERVALYDPAGHLVYQWGNHQTSATATALAVEPARPPLGAWRLALFGPTPPRGRITFGIGAGIAALALVLVVAGGWLYRESTRELRLAAERVSFVNQVSHELKTPLTNVRMYAELLEEHIDAGDETGRRNLAVVVAESQRLSRLITNILTFARAERGHLAIHPVVGCVDDVVRDVAAQFGPGFEARGVSVRLSLGAPGRVRVDADALSQILGNLLGNVEKYAPSGDVAITTAADGPLTRVTVHDSGPGIPVSERERVFQPFVRLGSAAHEGTPGTGIGLGIARELARLHGGDLRVTDAERGARFELTIRTEAA